MIPKPKQITVTKAKKKAWVAFSLYIRARDCLKTTGKLISGKCITCDTEYLFKKLQAGHFIPGRHNAILLDERGVHAQCYHCNVGLKGNWVPYRRKMVLMYGEEVIADLERLSNVNLERKAFEWLEDAEKYQKLYDLILRTRQLPPEGKNFSTEH